MQKTFFGFLQVMLQANPELHFISLFWFFIEVSKAHVILAYKQWESCSPDLNFLSLAEKWSWSVCTTCRSLNHTVVSVGKDRNPGVCTSSISHVWLFKELVVSCVCLWMCPGGDSFKLRSAVFSWLKFKWVSWNLPKLLSSQAAF